MMLSARVMQGVGGVYPRDGHGSMMFYVRGPDFEISKFLPFALENLALSQTSPASTAGAPAVGGLVVTENSDLKLVEGFGRGLLSDLKGKSKFLKSDFTDGFSIKVRSFAAL